MAIYKAGPAQADRRRHARSSSRWRPGRRTSTRGCSPARSSGRACWLRPGRNLGPSPATFPSATRRSHGKPDATFRIGSRFRTLYLATPDDPAVGRITSRSRGRAGAPRGLVERVRLRDERRAHVSAAGHVRGAVHARRFSQGAGRARAGAERAGAPKNTEEGKLPPGVEERLGRLGDALGRLLRREAQRLQDRRAVDLADLPALRLRLARLVLLRAADRPGRCPVAGRAIREWAAHTTAFMCRVRQFRAWIAREPCT